MRRGLVVGKFMPFHRGHQFVIETALAHADDVTVIVYDSKVDFTDPDHPGYAYGWDHVMPVQKRAKWISDLYPQLENVLPRRDIYAGLSQEERDDPKWAAPYAADLAVLGKFDYVFTSEDYGEPFATALGARHIVVDQLRQLVPISGTQIRENLYENRVYLDPLVYRSLIQKIVFVGTESAGKTTIASRMAEELDTQWVHEYGRELWEAQGGSGSFRDLLKIAENHYAREQAAALQAREYLFCDTNPWTTLQWSLMYSGSADARLWDLAERTVNEYKWIVCEPDFGWVDDGWRELPGEKGSAFHKQLLDDLHARQIQYFTVRGSTEDRVLQIKQFLGVHEHSHS